MTRYDNSYKTTTLPVVLCIVVSFVSYHMKVISGDENYLIIALYFWVATLYGYGEYERRHKDSPPKYPILTAQFLCLTYVPCLVIRKLIGKK